jgi:DNA-3-methyladenine glycosylase
VGAARALLGARLVRDGDGARRSGRIVEVEAYDGPRDRASHARFGRTARNAVMFGPPGLAYVYLVYGMYDCLNVVAGPDGTPSAILVRAVAPLEGFGAMRAARIELAGARRRSPDAAARTAARIAREPDVRLASGPGRLAAAFSIDRRLDGLDLCDPRSVLRLEAPPAAEPAPVVRASARVGIAYAGEPWVGRAWRFSIVDDRSVSGPRPAPAPGGGDPGPGRGGSGGRGAA